MAMCPQSAGAWATDGLQMGDMSKEPSMEEILSSIKRIIAEDGDASARKEPKSPGRRDAERESHRKAVVASLAKEADEGLVASSYVDEVLELTEEMPRVGKSPQADEPVADDSDIFELDDLVDDTALDLTETFEIAEAMEETPPMPKASPAPAVETPEIAPPVAAVAINENIISAESAGAARSSLDALSSLLVKPAEPEAADNTLEGLVREMLRPMMKEWLDANLPRLVEGMVAKEIARITGRPL